MRRTATSAPAPLRSSGSSATRSLWPSICATGWEKARRGAGCLGRQHLGALDRESATGLVSACVGTGTFVDWPRQDAASYAVVLARARAAHDPAAVAELERIGAPPYRDTATDAIKSKYAGAFTPAEAAAFAAMRRALESPPAGVTYFAHGLALGDPRALATAAYDQLRAEIVTFDARRLGRSFRVPMFFFQGEQDAYSTTDAVRDYVAWIDAPRKLLAVVRGAGHSLIFAGELLLERLLADVRPVVLEAERATGRNDARP